MQRFAVSARSRHAALVAAVPLSLAGAPPRATCESPAAVPSSAASATDVISLAQRGIQGVKDGSGLPWWAAILSTTVVVRSALLPLVPLGAQATTRLVEALPAFGKLNQLYLAEMRQIRLRASSQSNLERTRALTLYVDSFVKIVKLHKVSFLRIVLAPAAQIGAMVLFVVAMRRSVGAGGGDQSEGEARPPAPVVGAAKGLAGLDDASADPQAGIAGPSSASPGDAPDGPRRLAEGTLPGMETGGVLWFRDLTVPDESYRLPVAALVLTYANIELSLGTAGAGVAFLKTVQDLLQLGLIFAAPSVCTLPSGVFLYWITNGLWTAGQRALLRHNPALRALMGLPALKLRVPKP